MADMFNQSRSIYWGGEIAKPILKSNNQDFIETFDKFNELLTQDINKSCAFSVYGFEIKPFHIQAICISYEDFINYLQQLGFSRFIVLERKNHLRKIVSSMVASQYGSWHQPNAVRSSKKQISLNTDCVTIDGQKKSLIEFLRDYENDLTKIRKSLMGENVLEISYEEDILPSPEKVAKQCYAYFGVKPGRITTRYGRTNPHPMSELVVNYNDVRKALRGTKFEWMLDA